jgi:DNA-binding transcriptional regulator/RsmH inhibitor MraZ
MTETPDTPLTISIGGTVPLPKTLIDRARAESPDGTADFTLVYPRPDKGAGRLLIFTTAEMRTLLDRIATMPAGSLERAAAERLFIGHACDVTADHEALHLPDRLADLFAPLPRAVLLKPGQQGLELYAPSHAKDPSRT